MTNGGPPSTQGRLAVAIVMEGLSDEGGSEAQATALAELLARNGHATLLASRWPLPAGGDRVARLRAAGVDIVTPKWVTTGPNRMAPSAYNARRAIRAAQFAARRRTIPTPDLLRRDPEVLETRDHDVRAILTRKLRRWVRRQHPSPCVVHVLARHSAALLPDLTPLGFPVVYSELGQADFYLGPGGAMARLGVDALTADSSEGARLLEMSEGQPVQVIPSIGGFPGRTIPASPHARRFVMVNRLHPAKRVDLALRAAALLSPPASLKILGSGPQANALSELIAELGLQGSACLRGALGRREVEEALDEADAFVLASETEGTPTAVLEAMSRGRAVVAAPVGGVPDLVRHGSEGLLFDGTVDGLAAALRRLVDEEGLARRLGEAARRRWLDEFSAEQIAHRYETVYRHVLASSRARDRSVVGPPRRSASER